MIPTGMSVIGATETTAYMGKQAILLPLKVNALIRYWSFVMKTKIQAHASGRPGPNAPTGDYRRSWTVMVTKDGDTTTGVVGTNRPQGPRLEFGFVGADSLGRVYNQPPFPHVGPARDEIEEPLKRGFETLVRTM